MKSLPLIFGFSILVLASSAHAGNFDDRCGGPGHPECEAWLSGNGAHAGAPTNCIVEISAQTYGGKISLDVRDANGVGRWVNKKGKPAPRIKHVGPGVVTWRIGCGWLQEPTESVWMCADDGTQPDGHSSVRIRASGSLDEALKTRRLVMSLVGTTSAPQNMF